MTFHTRRRVHISRRGKSAKTPRKEVLVSFAAPSLKLMPRTETCVAFSSDPGKGARCQKTRATAGPKSGSPLIPHIAQELPSPKRHGAQQGAGTIAHPSNCLLHSSNGVSSHQQSWRQHSRSGCIQHRDTPRRIRHSTFRSFRPYPSLALEGLGPLAPFPSLLPPPFHHPPHVLLLDDRRADPRSELMASSRSRVVGLIRLCGLLE